MFYVAKMPEGGIVINGAPNKASVEISAGVLKSFAEFCRLNEDNLREALLARRTFSLGEKASIRFYISVSDDTLTQVLLEEEGNCRGSALMNQSMMEEFLQKIVNWPPSEEE